MKKLFLALFLGLIIGQSVHAQTEASVSAAELDTERTRISNERAAADRRALKERTACYQKFAVEDCLSASRLRQRLTLEQLRRDEARINDITRRERGGKALDRLDQKNAPQRAEDAEAKRDRSLESHQGREQRAADHATGRASAAERADANRRAQEKKQQAHAEHQARQAAVRDRASAERERHEDKLRRAETHRTERDKKNAERKKPRAAPLAPAAP